MTAWSIKLEGDPTDLALLAEALAGNSTTVVENNDGYYLSHAPLNEIEDYAAVRAELGRMIVRLQALARMRWGRNIADLHGSVVVGVDEDGNSQTYLDVGTAVVRARAMPMSLVVTSADGHPVAPPPDPLPGELQLALDDEAVDDALYFLQRSDPSWSELYKVYEIVRADIGHDGIVSNGWASKDDLSRLTGTAHHPALAGRAARHARVRERPMANPMPLTEAQDLAHRIVGAWIASKTTA